MLAVCWCSPAESPFLSGAVLLLGSCSICLRCSLQVLHGLALDSVSVSGPPIAPFSCVHFLSHLFNLPLVATPPAAQMLHRRDRRGRSVSPPPLRRLLVAGSVFHFASPLFPRSLLSRPCLVCDLRVVLRLLSYSTCWLLFVAIHVGAGLFARLLCGRDGIVVRARIV